MARCECSGDVDSDWLTTVGDSTDVGIIEALELLEQAHEFHAVCKDHKNVLGKNLGLRIMYDKELDTAWDLIYQSRDDIWKLKTDPSTYPFFKKAQRPSRPREMLAIHRFMHQMPQYTVPSDLLLDDLEQRYPHETADWHIHGKATLEKILTW